MKKSVMFLVLLVILCMPVSAFALNLNTVNLTESTFKEVITTPEMRIPFNAETVSENVNTYTGELEVEATDLVLPGKNGFDVEIKRRYQNQESGVEAYVYFANSKRSQWGRTTVLPYRSANGTIYEVAFQSEDDIQNYGMNSIIIDITLNFDIYGGRCYIYPGLSSITDPSEQIQVTRIEGVEAYTVDYDYEAGRVLSFLYPLSSNSNLTRGWYFLTPEMS